jgi:hypothetical protein
MKYLLTFLLIVFALIIVCGAVGLLAYGWFAIAESETLPPLPAPAEPEVLILPTPTLIVNPDGNGNGAFTPIGATPVQSTPIPLTPGEPFDGTFSGTLNSNDGSQAPVTLVLVQEGAAVTGEITIGEGLSLDGGSCGAQAVPAGAQRASGQVDPANPNHLNAGATYIIQGFTITLNLDATLAGDGRTLTTNATIDLPFLCADPAISGTFTRQ